MMTPPPESRATIFISNGSKWQTWRKPPDASMVYMFLLGSGAGGAYDYSDSSGNWQGPGGSGAAAGGLLIPALFLPDMLYVSVPAGGGIEASGGSAYVCVYPSTTLQYRVMYSGDVATAGVAPVGGPAPEATDFVFGALGVWSGWVGQDGWYIAAVWGATGRPWSAGAGGGYGVTGITGLVPTIATDGGRPGAMRVAPWAFTGAPGCFTTVGHPGSFGSGGGGRQFDAGVLPGLGGSGLVMIASW